MLTLSSCNSATCGPGSAVQYRSGVLSPWVWRLYAAGIRIQLGVAAPELGYQIGGSQCATS